METLSLGEQDYLAWEREGRREKEDKGRESGRVQVATAPAIQRNSAADVPWRGQNKETAFQQHRGERSGERLDGKWAAV